MLRACQGLSAATALLSGVPSHRDHCARFTWPAVSASNLPLPVANGHSPRPGGSHGWSLNYISDPTGGQGSITLTLDGQPVRLAVEAEHVQSGAGFDRFGIVTTWIDGNGQHVYFDDLTYTERQ